MTEPTRLHAVDRGTGTPLVLLHGFSVDHRLLLPLDPVVERAGGWRRIYLDLPGMGRSPVGDVAGAEDVVRSVEAEIDARLGDQPFAVLGSSFGGMVARAVAHDLRDRVLGLATVAGLAVADHTARDVPPHTVLHRDRSALDVAATGGPGAAEAYQEVAVVQDVDGARVFLDAVWPGLQSADQDALARIQARYTLDHRPEDSAPFTRPALFLTARQDAVVGYRDAWATLEHYPRATFAVLDEAGHNVHLDRPGPTAALLTDWLDRMRTAAA